MGSRYKLAGYVGVESGNVMIHDIPESEIDQALSKHTKAYREPYSQGFPPSGFPDYDDFVETTDKMGVIVNGFGGDGSYPVYLRYDKHGLVTEARIIFDGRRPGGVSDDPTT